MLSPFTLESENEGGPKLATLALKHEKSDVVNIRKKSDSFIHGSRRADKTKTVPQRGILRILRESWDMEVSHRLSITLRTPKQNPQKNKNSGSNNAI